MRSVVVVLPASMWAMMPIFRIFSIGTVRAINACPTTYDLRASSPPIVGKRLIRLRHPMDIILFLNRSTAHVRGVVQFVRQLIGHAFFRASPRVDQNPAYRQDG